MYLIDVNANQYGHLEFKYKKKEQAHKEYRKYIISNYQPRFCEMLISEVENFEKWIRETDFEIVRPNSMNNYGAVLDDFGMEGTLDTLMKDFVRHISKVYFADVGGFDLDSHHGFVVEYGVDRDVDLGFHTDDSEVTLNVCLGKQFTGGDLFFRGMRCEDHVNGQIYPEEVFDFSHTVGRAIVHRGRHRHGASATTSGHRINLILWCRSSVYRELKEHKNDFLEFCGECKRENERKACALHGCKPAWKKGITLVIISGKIVEFAKRYEHNKKREDLQRYEELKLKKLVEDEFSGPEEYDDSSSEDDEEDDVIKFDPKHEVQFVDALLKIRNNDPVLKNKEVELFDDVASDDVAEEGKVKRGEKKKKVYLKDVNANLLLENGADFADVADDDDDVEKDQSFYAKMEAGRKEFLDAVMWLEKDEGSNGNVNDGFDGFDIDVSDDDEIMWRQEDFEREINFRHQEGGEDRVMVHPRKIEGSVRKVESARQRQRESKKEREAERKIEMTEEIKRLKNVKKEEMNEKLKKFREIAGIGEGEDCVLDVRDLEGDFDPEEYDRKMKKAFDDKFYTKDILVVDDKELNQLIPLKKLATYREDEFHVPYNKIKETKQRIRSQLKGESSSGPDNGGKRSKNDAGKPVKQVGGAETENPESETQNEGEKKQSRKQRRKERLQELKLAPTRRMAYNLDVPKKKKKNKA
ncbi:2-oxoglutarate (2OG) and Fe(II)-dependent oxygenase superfamily protein [Artemisia annua]|uniref:2-oxoglutarate (2OG) and Fe(II)-dependent oxygenase superfamily protein n=1 Tax=Artemisia annua TaxID=35608 RepID=A0A2U1QAD1_ARTAN|nr:2-oxoglutarate (2OG) and Fe(II)-dependent oxygenase superfamily protein [Artemisia annua]